METRTKPEGIAPPRLITALQAGFNDTANHIYLILFPVLFDLFLWLGPRLSVRKIFEPVFEAWMDSVNRVGTTDLQAFMAANQQVLKEFFEQFNMAVALRTFPIGIPSLFSAELSKDTPFGAPWVVDGADWVSVFLALVIFTFAGLVLGSLYFTSVAKVSWVEKNGYTAATIIAHIIQTLLLTFSLVLVLLAISIPVFIILTVLAMIAPGLAEFGGLILMFFVLWLLLPLVFSPHGIFSAGLNAFNSVYTSVRLVRFFLPGTGTFVVASLVLNEGLSVLWRIPEASSWMTLVGILGHGFIATGLLSASFVYYQVGLKWMNENLAKLSTAGTKAI